MQLVLIFHENLRPTEKCEPEEIIDFDATFRMPINSNSNFRSWNRLPSSSSSKQHRRRIYNSFIKQ